MFNDARARVYNVTQTLRADNVALALFQHSGWGVGFGFTDDLALDLLQRLIVHGDFVNGL